MAKRYLVNDSLFYAENSYVEHNSFIDRQAENEILPEYESSKDILPHPVWEGHDDAIRAYDFAWKIAFGNLRQPIPDTGFVSNYIDTAFNGYLFMWDSSFITMFGKYGCKVFNFQKTLDNFYSHQHRDGYICREICEEAPGEQFQRDDPSGTGPNILPWSEWEYYQSTGDLVRLREVFYPLLAYHKWLQLNRTWRDGSYWSTGLACGMDNMHRLQSEYTQDCSHGHQIWMDTCVQMVISGKVLIKMSQVLGCPDETAWLTEETNMLTTLINEKLWSDKDNYYYDLWKNGELSGVKSIGAYWSLLADIVPSERLNDFIAHLENEKEFNRPHRIPTLSADNPHYKGDGEYWNGSVWAPTNYMVLKGLEKNGYHDLAYEIACNHHQNVVRIFNETDTLWENYGPENGTHGNPAKGDFVGWTGLVPISILFEYVFGIHADAQNHHITWYVNRLEKHGIMNYPLGNTTVDILCDERNTSNDKPNVHITCKENITVKLIWNGQVEVINHIAD